MSVTCSNLCWAKHSGKFLASESLLKVQSQLAVFLRLAAAALLERSGVPRMQGMKLPQFRLRTLLILIAALALLLAQRPYSENVRREVFTGWSITIVEGPRPTLPFVATLAFEAGALSMWLLCKWLSYRAARQKSHD